MNKFAFVDTRTVDEALGQLGDGAVIKAGGIDLLDLMKEDIVSPPKLVNIRNIDSLRGITSAPDGLQLGPLSTLSEIAAHPEIQQRYTALSDAAGHAATPQVRNMATLGGNIMQRPRCWYFRSSDFDCKKKGEHQQRVSCPQRGEPIPRHHQQRHLRDGAPLLDRRAAFGHGRTGGAHVEARQAHGRR